MIIKFISITVLTIFLNSCGIYKPTDARKTPVNANERVKKNIEEGRGFRLSSLNNNKGGDFLFATSNPMWRAAIEKLNFAPLSVVDYSGGIIITDWFGDIKNENNEEIKITVRFLSNEIRSDAVDIILHKRTCAAINGCKTIKIDNQTNQEIKSSILKTAVKIQNQDLTNIKKENEDYKIPGKNF